MKLFLILTLCFGLIIEGFSQQSQPASLMFPTEIISIQEATGTVSVQFIYPISASDQLRSKLHQITKFFAESNKVDLAVTQIDTIAGNTCYIGIIQFKNAKAFYNTIQELNQKFPFLSPYTQVSYDISWFPTPQLNFSRIISDHSTLKINSPFYTKLLLGSSDHQNVIGEWSKLSSQTGSIPLIAVLPKSFFASLLGIFVGVILFFLYFLVRRKNRKNKSL